MDSFIFFKRHKFYLKMKFLVYNTLHKTEIINYGFIKFLYGIIIDIMKKILLMLLKKLQNISHSFLFQNNIAKILIYP